MASTTQGAVRRLIRPLIARDVSEAHRAATPLELFYDLVLVVAIAAAAAGLHHEIAAGHFADGILVFAFVFWALWWPWVNFTWFASAFDNDDAVYRCLVFAQMIGALIVAAGIKYAFSDFDFTIGLVGYIIMRLSMIALWMRAANANPGIQNCAYRYAIGIGLCQIGWFVAIAVLPKSLFIPASLLIMIAEMIVPALAESTARTAWHRHHIVERYGLLTIIVLGESILASLTAVGEIAKSPFENPLLLSVLAGGLLAQFAMWWIYFGERYHSALDTLSGAFQWGYSHYFIFASAAAVGAGIAIVVDQLTHHAEISLMAANASFAIPAAIYLLSVWFAHDRNAAQNGYRNYQLPIFAAILLATPLLPVGVLAAGIVLAACLILRVREDTETQTAVHRD